MVFGEAAKSWVITVIPDYHGFLLAILPPGAFIAMGILIAAKNWIDLRQAKKAKAAASITPATQAA